VAQPASARPAVTRQFVGPGSELRTTAVPRQSISPDQVDDALRSLPADGWTSCWTGRRDRALLVLSQMAGLSFQAIAELTVADVSIAEGVAVIRTPGGATRLRSAPDGRICGPCALARWLRALDLTTVHASPSVVTAVIARAAPVTANSPHLCQGRTEVSPPTQTLPLLPSIDQWGPVTPRNQPATAIRLAGTGVDAGADRTLARPAITRGRPTAVRQPAVQLPTPPEPNGAAARLLSAPVGSADRTNVLPGFSPRLNLVRSNYSRLDRERTIGAPANGAEGLEGRARALLQPSTH
jgi:hypothetical protein